MGNSLLRLSLALLAGLAAAFPQKAADVAEPPAERSPVDFRRDVLPLLADRCFACHGPDEAARKGKLRLDRREDALRPARSGEVPIFPGKATASELIRRIHAEGPSERMPPPSSRKTLSPAERDLLRRWIDAGAPYATHWAFEKPRRPAMPKVRGEKWCRNPIDRFVLARLEAAGLTPSPEADRPTLVRRLSFDLRGLPPNLEEVDAFLKDQRPDAYERLVDRFLASPRYGEKMAQGWLDLARFGDTSGFHFDSTRQMWLWRDWVIRAFNDDMPYDRFSLEQLAGDLVPGATRDQKIASGFNRNTRFNEEGGVDPEEFVVRYDVDRTNTLGQVWLGLTLGCAECHDHKYDPVSQKDYYRLLAFFTGLKEPMVSMNHDQPLPPLLKVPTPEQEKTLAFLRGEIEAIERTIARILQEVGTAYRDPQGEPGFAKQPPQPTDFVWIEDQLPEGARTEGAWIWGRPLAQPVFRGRFSTLLRGEGRQEHLFSGARDPLRLQAGDRLFLYVQPDAAQPPRGFRIRFHDGSWKSTLYWGEPPVETNPKEERSVAMGPMPPAGKWTRLEISLEKAGLSPGAKVEGWSVALVDGTLTWDHAGLHRLRDRRPAASLAYWLQQAKDDPWVPPAMRDLLRRPAEKRTAEEERRLRDHYFRHLHEATRERLAPLEEELREMRSKLADTEEAVPTTLISEEAATPRPAYVRLRGDYHRKGERVDRGVPGFLPPMPAKGPSNRLGLARWLFQTDQPLTARVQVNRLWAQMFGSGLVGTPGDFGTQGERPTHPELLDWLAREFMEPSLPEGAASARPWSNKRLLRLLATSATYRQHSRLRPGKAQTLDPRNRLLSRAPRHRLTAEEIRDNALAVAGLLSTRIGGPSAMPYQPAGYYQGKNETWKWIDSTGEDQYRRGLYTFWRRTCLHPMPALFDAPSREECCVERGRTCTPLQALATLNDPTFAEAARVFAQRILLEGPADPDGRLTFAFRTALARFPSKEEMAVLQEHHAKFLGRFRDSRADASKFVHVGHYPRAANLDIVEHAAMTAMAAMLLNLDETITRE